MPVSCMELYSDSNRTSLLIGSRDPPIARYDLQVTIIASTRLANILAMEPVVPALIQMVSGCSVF